MLLDPAECLLIVIDHQPRLMPAIADGAQVLARARVLAQAAQRLHVPVLGTEQNPAKLGPLDDALRASCARVLPKLSFSACRDGLVDLIDDWAQAMPGRDPSRGDQRSNQRGPNTQPLGNARSLPKHLQKAVPPPAAPQRSHLVLAGCEAHVCLLQTALDLIDTEEFDVSIVTDACGSRRTSDRDAAFDRLAGAGAQLITTEMAVFEWLGSAEHAAFKEVQALIKPL
jgi:hypothetical protein